MSPVSCPSSFCAFLSCLVWYCFYRLENRLAAFLVVWGAVLGYLGWSWGPFWASWTVLAASWDRLGNVLRIYKPMQTFGAPLGSILRPPWHPKREPRRSPRRPKIDPKIDVKNDRFPARSANRLKPFLVRSWCRLGVGFGRFLLENVMFRENRRFR